MIDYKQKYLKYKKKYLDAKAILIGGGLKEDIIEEIKRREKRTEPSVPLVENEQLKSIFKKYASVDQNRSLKDRLDSLNDEEKIVLASRLYAFNFDRVLNSLLRGTDLENRYYDHMLEFLNDFYENYNNVKQADVHSDFFNPWRAVFSEDWVNDRYRYRCSTVSSIIKYLNIKTKDDILECVKFMYNTITKSSVVLDRDMYVYRGLIVNNKTDYDYMKLKGMNSTSYNFDSACQIFFGNIHRSYRTDDPIVFSKLTEDAPQILKIKLPRGTKVFTPDICTLQKENEILILSEGDMKVINKTKETVTTTVKVLKDIVKENDEYKFIHFRTELHVTKDKIMEICYVPVNIWEVELTDIKDIDFRFN